MLDLFLDEKKLRELFKSVDNVFQAELIKENINNALEELKTPSPELLKMLEKEGITKDSLLPEKTSKPSRPRKINIENRKFLLEGESVVKMLVGAAVKSQIDKGSIVKSYKELTEDQKAEAEKLV